MALLHSITVEVITNDAINVEDERLTLPNNSSHTEVFIEVENLYGRGHSCVG